MTQLPPSLLSLGHTGTETHTAVWVGVRVGVSPPRASSPSVLEVPSSI